jgi:hypothetical protein
MVAPQFWHEYLRLPPLAVFSMRSPQSGHAFCSCLIGFRVNERNCDVTTTMSPDAYSRGWPYGNFDTDGKGWSDSQKPFSWRSFFTHRFASKR